MDSGETWSFSKHTGKTFDNIQNSPELFFKSSLKNRNKRKFPYSDKIDLFYPLLVPVSNCKLANTNQY